MICRKQGRGCNRLFVLLDGNGSARAKIGKGIALAFHCRGQDDHRKGLERSGPFVVLGAFSVLIVENTVGSNQKKTAAS